MQYAVISILLILDAVGFYFLLRDFLHIKKRAEEDYPLYLIELYNKGLITKNQVDVKDMALFNKYYKEETRKERFYKLAILAGLIGVAIILLFTYFVEF